MPEIDLGGRACLASIGSRWFFRFFFFFLSYCFLPPCFHCFFVRLDLCRRGKYSFCGQRKALTGIFFSISSVFRSSWSLSATFDSSHLCTVLFSFLSWEMVAILRHKCLEFIVSSLLSSKGIYARCPARIPIAYVSKTTTYLRERNFC